MPGDLPMSGVRTDRRSWIASENELARHANYCSHDGVHATEVSECALFVERELECVICVGEGSVENPIRFIGLRVVQTRHTLVTRFAGRDGVRSEERRVGKEW